MKIQKHFISKTSNSISIIIAEKCGVNMTKTDSIIIHTACILSDSVSVIDNLEINDDVNIIYLCGHGSADKQTIGGRSLSEIAKLLVESGYSGKQNIFITACESSMLCLDRKVKVPFYYEKNMVTNLSYELEKLGVILDNMRIESKSDGSSITLSNTCGGLEIYVIKSTSVLDDATMWIQAIKQRYITLGGKKVSVSHLNMLEDIKCNYEKQKTKIEGYKRRLISSELPSFELEEGLNIVALCLGFFLGSVLFGLTLSIFSSVFYMLKSNANLLIIGVLCTNVVTHIITKIVARKYTYKDWSWLVFILTKIIRYTVYTYVTWLLIPIAV